MDDRFLVEAGNRHTIVEALEDYIFLGFVWLIILQWLCLEIPLLHLELS